MIAMKNRSLSVWLSALIILGLLTPLSNFSFAQDVDPPTAEETKEDSEDKIKVDIFISQEGKYHLRFDGKTKTDLSLGQLDIELKKLPKEAMLIELHIKESYPYTYVAEALRITSGIDKADVKLVSMKETDDPLASATKKVETPVGGKIKGAASGAVEKVIYIPYSKLSEVFERDDSNVLLPSAEYKRLLAAAKQVEGYAEKPPVDAVIGDIHYEGKIKDEIAEIVASLSVEALSDRWVKLPVKFPGAAISSVDGATLEAIGPGSYYLIFKGKGAHDIKVNLTQALGETAQGKQLRINGPVAGSTSLKLTIPTGGLQVEVQPKLSTAQIVAAEKQTTISAVLGATNQITVSWRAKSRSMMAQDALAIANNKMVVRVADGVIYTKAVLDYQVLRGSISELAFTIPKGEKLLDVQSQNIRERSVVEDDNGQHVKVQLYNPVKSRVSIVVETERDIPAGAFSAGTIHADNVQRETGFIVLRSGDELSLNVAEDEDITRVSEGDVPSDLSRYTNSLFYKFFAKEYTLKVTTSPVEPRISVKNIMRYTLGETRFDGNITLSYDIKRAGIFSVQFLLPKGFDVDTVQGPAVERFEAEQRADDVRVTVNFRNKTIGATTLNVQLHQQRDNVNDPLQIPILEPLNVRSERGYVTLHAHESLEVNTDEEKTKGTNPISPAELKREGITVGRISHHNVVAAYRFFTRPVEIGFSVKKRNTRVTADTFTIVNVMEDSVETKTKISYNVLYAGTDLFEIHVPKAISKRIEITGDNIKEKKAGEPVDGMVPWTVTLHTKVLGTQQSLEVTFREPIKLETADGSTIDYKVHLCVPQNLERESGQIVVIKDRALALDAKTEDVEPIDPRQVDFSKVDSSDLNDIQFSYRYHKHPVSVDLNVTKHEIQRVVETVVTRTFVESQIPVSGDIKYRTRYRLKSSKRQRLPVKLPEGAEILEVNVAGKNVTPEKSKETKGVFLININRTTDNDQAFDINILYSVKVKEEDALAYTGAINLGMPQLVGDVSYQQIFWKISLPNEYCLTDKPAGFANENFRYGLAGQLERAFFGPRTSAFKKLKNWNDEWDITVPESLVDFPVSDNSYIYSTLESPDWSKDSSKMVIEYGFLRGITAACSGIFLLVMMIFLFARISTKFSLVLFSLVLLTAGLIVRPEITVLVAGAGAPGMLIGFTIWVFREALVFFRKTKEIVQTNGPALAGAAGSFTKSVGTAIASKASSSSPPDQKRSEPSVLEQGEFLAGEEGTSTDEESRIEGLEPDSVFGSGDSELQVDLDSEAGGRGGILPDISSELDKKTELGSDSSDQTEDEQKEEGDGNE